jgi:glutaredoxin domain-containing cysteine-rich protein 1
VLETRSEDRGLLLFTSSMSAVKTTAESCRQAEKLLEALLINFQTRDIFVNIEYANQLRRLHAAHLASLPSQLDANGSAAVAASSDGNWTRKTPLPPLPQLYANGKLIGSLEELRYLDDEGQLTAVLEEYKRDCMPEIGMDGDSGCDVCGDKRFVVCVECNGSRRGRKVFDKYMKCSHCNENGLQVCTACA